MARKRKAKETEGTKEILAGMKEWRKAHPKATFVEIEAEMEARIKGLREQVLGEIIEMSAATEAEGQILHCPACGAAMERRGKRDRRLQGAGGSEVEIERVYLECPACGAGFFPSG
jgi:YgiT-type zinc finger domain-containing protein